MGLFRALALAVLVVAGASSASLPRVVSSTEPGSWESAGEFNTWRRNTEAVLLNDGRVLAIGGYDFDFTETLASVEAFDPNEGGWTEVGGMNTSRSGHSATRLADGRVLVAGGEHQPEGESRHMIASVEIYDPVSGFWTLADSLPEGRRYHSATLLGDGRVLLAGGQVQVNQFSAYTGTTLLYDPALDDWEPGPGMGVTRAFHVAESLDDGTVLIAGGFGFSGTLNQAQRFDPVTDTFLATTSMITPRDNAASTVLSDGRVVVSGGTQVKAADYVAAAEIYDPANDSWSGIDSLSHARTCHDSVQLPDGRVLVAGGAQDDDPFPDTEVYAGTLWGAGPTMLAGRCQTILLRLLDGRILSVAGADLLTQPGSELLSACGNDADCDGCSGALETGDHPAHGGDRDPANFWDFYDVTGDASIDLADTIAILQKFGVGPAAAGYDPSFDRYAPDPDKLWRTAAAVGPHVGIDVADAITNLQSFGHSCA